VITSVQLNIHLQDHLHFTEQGVAMLSSILNSERAIAVNIQIIRVFTRIEELRLTLIKIFLRNLKC